MTARTITILSAVATLAACDVPVGSVIPDELRTAACVVDVVPDALPVIDDAIADSKTQAEKVRDAVPLTPADVDGTTAIVNIATRVRVCMERKQP